MFQIAALLLLSAAVSLISGDCKIHHPGEVRCSCDPKIPSEASGLYMTFNAFEFVTNVTVSDCHNVTFVGDVYMPDAPRNIRFFNITHLYHQVENRKLSSNVVAAASVIERIEFVNVNKIYDLHLNELFPVNRVDLLLLKNVGEVVKMECLPKTLTKPDIVPSRITEVRIEHTFIKDLLPYSFTLVNNRKFIIKNARIFTWSSKAIDVGQDNRLFSVVDTRISALQEEPISGRVVEEAEIIDSTIINALSNAFSAFSLTKNVRITGNEIRNGHYNAFVGLFKWTSNRTVDFSRNALPCPLASAPGRLSLCKLNTRALNNTCISEDGSKRNFTPLDRYYDIGCQPTNSTSAFGSPQPYVIVVSLLLILRKKS